MGSTPSCGTHNMEGQYMNDFDLVKRCKRNNKKAKLELFQKYHNYHLNKYASLKRKCKMVFLDFDDFEGEAYFWFEKAIEYVDLAKLTNPLAWKFLNIYSYHLNTLIDRIIKREQKGWIRNESLNVPYPGDDEPRINHVAAAASSEFDSSVERFLLQREFVKNFLRTLTPLEMTIYEISARELDNGKVPTLNTLSKRLGYSRAWIGMMKKNIKDRYKKALAESL